MEIKATGFFWCFEEEKVHFSTRVGEIEIVMRLARKNLRAEKHKSIMVVETANSSRRSTTYLM